MHLTCCHDVPAPCKTFEIVPACFTLQDVAVLQGLQGTSCSKKSHFAQLPSLQVLMERTEEMFQQIG